MPLKGVSELFAWQGYDVPAVLISLLILSYGVLLHVWG